MAGVATIGMEIGCTGEGFALLGPSCHQPQSAALRHCDVKHFPLIPRSPAAVPSSWSRLTSRALQSACSSVCRRAEESVGAAAQSGDLNSQVFVDYRPNQTALTFTRIGHSDRGTYVYQLLRYTAYFVCR